MLQRKFRIADFNDSIYTGDGDDIITGGIGNDTLNVRNGNDILIGVDPNSSNPGRGEIDSFTGGLGRDRFILGDVSWLGYDDGDSTLAGNNDYAQISDFNPTDDIIQLRGTSSNYLLMVSGTNTQLYLDKPGTEPDELIAILQNRTGLSLTGSYFNYFSALPNITLAINPASVNEDGTPNLIYTFTRDGSLTNPLTVNYTTTPINATANSDYTHQTGTLTIAANSSIGTIFIPILNDNLNEVDEAFTVTLSNPINATLSADSVGEVIITDTWQSNITRTLPSGVENLRLIGDNPINGTGNAGNNVLTGNSANNTLAGLAGNDAYVFTANSYLGLDTISETTTGGIDTLDLSGTNNPIRLNLGSISNQTVVTGNLTLKLSAVNVIENAFGGSGNDRFSYLTGRAFMASDIGLDTLTDFTPNADKLSLSKTTFSALTSAVGNGFSQATNFAIVEDDALVETSAAFIVYSSNSGSLFYNQNGSALGLGTGVEFTVLVGSPALTASDFTLVA